jgi:hypothetical protein
MERVATPITNINTNAIHAVSKEISFPLAFNILFSPYNNLCLLFLYLPFHQKRPMRKKSLRRALRISLAFSKITP